MVNEVVQRIFKGAGKKLPLQINRKKPGAGVDVFVACHAVSAITKSMTRY
jgi:hypothetical protein